MAQALSTGRAIRGIEAIAERLDGGRVPFAAYTTPLYDGSGAPAGAVHMLIDLSERTRAETSRPRHLEEQAALFEFTNRLFRAGSATHIYEAALDAILRALACQRASILLSDDACSAF